MPRAVAFLAGINVGGHRVKMDRLKELFTELKLANAATFIASGNVLFDLRAGTDTAKLETKIEGHLGSALGYAVPTYIRTMDEVRAAVDGNPFAIPDGYSLHVCFMKQALGPVDLTVFESPLDELKAPAREIYWLCHGRITESKVNWKRLAKQTGATSTARNITMLRRLLE